LEMYLMGRGGFRVGVLGKVVGGGSWGRKLGVRDLIWRGLVGGAAGGDEVGDEVGDGWAGEVG